MVSSNENLIRNSKLLNKNLFSKIITKNFISQNFEIQSFEINPSLEAGENFFSTILRARIKIKLIENNKENDQEFSFIIKSLDCAFFDERFIKVTNVFPKEVILYQKIIPEIEKIWRNAGEIIEFAPKLYHVSTEASNQFFIFEDLCSLNYELANRINGLNLQQIENVLVIIAKWHAASVIYANNNGPYDEIFNAGLFVKELELEFGGQYDIIFNDFVNILNANPSIDRCYVKKIENWRNKIFKKNMEIAKAKADGFNVLNHGDAWINNIMFQNTGSSDSNAIKLIDFQLNVYSTPAIDILYFLMSSVEPKFLVLHFDRFIKRYHFHLENSFKKLKYATDKIPTLRQIHLELERNSFYGAMLLIKAIPIFKINQKLDGIDLGTIVRDDKIGAESRKCFYGNHKVLNTHEILIPFLGERGMLDI